MFQTMTCFVLPLDNLQCSQNHQSGMGDWKIRPAGQVVALQLKKRINQLKIGASYLVVLKRVNSLKNGVQHIHSSYLLSIGDFFFLIRQKFQKKVFIQYLL